MRVKNKTLKIKTKKIFEFIDITNQIEGFVKEEKIKNGQILVYSRHTTLAIRINEKESGIFHDFENFLQKILPKEKYYKHNDLGIRTENLVCSPGAAECLNGHSHYRQLLLGTSETIPIVDSKLYLGTWQRVLAIELDGPKNREIFLQVIGE